jgi:hypothetical protein
VPSLQPELGRLTKLADLLLQDVVAAGDIDLRFQRLIAETAMLRLFYALDNFTNDVALKLLTNTNYIDNTIPARSRPAFRSSALAEAAIRAARPRLRYLKWTQLSDVTANLATFLPAGEHFLVERAVADPVMEHMRHVRNHIAHGTAGTAAKFRLVVNAVYGGHPRGISPGKLLLSHRTAFLGAPTRDRPRVIEQYLQWAKVAAKTFVRG